MGVKIKAAKWQGTPVLRVSGKAGGGDVLTVSRKLEGLMNKTSERAVLDLSDIAFLDSNWMGVLIASWKLYREKGKELLFLVPPGFVRDLFRNAGLERVFTFISSPEEL